MRNIVTKHIEFLQSVMVFRNLTQEELQHIIPFIFTREYKTDEPVFLKSDKDHILYIVRYGKLKLEKSGISEKTYSSGDVFGEIAVINKKYRTGSVHALENCLLFCMKGEDLLNTELIPPATSLKIILELSKIVTAYLTTSENTTTQALIENGETDIVEFKSTLRFNLFTKKIDKEIEHAVLKTIAAFLNSAGGTLLIGVADDKTIVGLNIDGFKNDDKMLLHVTNLIENSLGVVFSQFINLTVEPFEETRILRIDVKPANVPAYLIYKNDEIFYIRSGPSTSQLKVSEIYPYLHNRFFK